MPDVLTPQELARLAYQAGFRGRDLILAVAIAIRESGGNPRAYNPETAAGTAAGSGSRGLWQIYGTAHPRYNNESAFDPAVNARAAFEVYREAGNRFTPWSTFNNGSASSLALTLGNLTPTRTIRRPRTGANVQTTQGVTQPSAGGQPVSMPVIGNGAHLASIGHVTGNTGTGSNYEGMPADVIAEAAGSVFDSLGERLLGKTADGRQREPADAAAYIGGIVLILLGLIFLFIKSGAAEKTVEVIAGAAIPG